MGPGAGVGGGARMRLLHWLPVLGALLSPFSPADSSSGKGGTTTRSSSQPGTCCPCSWVQGTGHEICAGLGCANHGEALGWGRGALRGQDSVGHLPEVTFGPLSTPQRLHSYFLNMWVTPPLSQPISALEPTQGGSAPDYLPSSPEAD